MPLLVGYTTVQKVRDEGVPDPPTDARIEATIELASRYIDEFCGQWFEPRERTYLVDARGHRTLFFDVPIIEVTSIKEVNTSGGVLTTYSDTSFVVYNRHIRIGMVDPDDRYNPKIERMNPADPWAARLYGQSWWPRGQQNIQVEGWFGFTEYDGGTTPRGITPLLIERACTLIVIREVWQRWGEDTDSEEARFRSRLKSEKTRDQSYALGGVATSLSDAIAGGRLTGDPDIDNILVQYRRSIGIATA